MRRLSLTLLLALLILLPASSFSLGGQNKGFAAAQDMMSVTGNAAIRSAANGNIVVIVDESRDGAADGVPDLVFRFAPKKKSREYQNFSLDVQNATIHFSSRRLAVISPEGRIIASLSLEKVQNDDPEFFIYGDRSKDSPGAIRIARGLGLKRQTPKRAEGGSPLPVNVDEDFIFDGVRAQNEPGGAGCQSGGAGATSCGISCGNGQGCNVSCGGGLWACCNCPHDCGCTR